MPLPLIYIAVFMFFVGAAPLPYGYYTLLRLVATGVLVWAAFVSYERRSEVLPWIFGILAILFNPIIKIHLPKEAWMAIDIGTGILLLATKSRIQEHKHDHT